MQYEKVNKKDKMTSLGLYYLGRLMLTSAGVCKTVDLILNSVNNCKITVILSVFLCLCISLGQPISAHDVCDLCHECDLV